MRILVVLTALFVPAVASAQTLEFWLFEMLTLLERVVIPAMIALAFFVFIWNAFKFFILQGDSEEGHDRAKQLMIYGILALVLIFIFLGIVNLLVRLFGLGSPYSVCPDYDPHCNTRGFEGRSADDGFLFPQSGTRESGDSNEFPITDPVSEPGGRGGV